MITCPTCDAAARNCQELEFCPECAMSAVKIGDYVSFKCDIEQGSKVANIRKCGGGRYGTELLVEVTAGEYERGPMWIDAADCWIEG